MKAKSIIALVATSMMGLMAQATDANWKTAVDQMIANGEFARAEAFMKKLPRDVRKQQAVRIDSLNTIMSRIRKDFNITPEEGLKRIKVKVPSVTEAQLETWKRTRKLEVMNIDGQEWWFRKSIGNLWLLADEFAEDHAREKQQNFAGRRKHYLQAMATAADVNGVRNWHTATITFTLDVNADAVPAGETLRVWMPFPYENLRQRNIKLLSSNRNVTMSEGSKHHTVYMEAIAEKGKPTHFEYSFSYEVGERHVAQPDILAMLEPYDKNSEVYKRYTMSEAPHMVVTQAMRDKALEIVGTETNPVLQAAKLHAWISRSFPWAGAREYSTIANMSDYVLLNGHGDCGQVALLYITLCRSIGIPARWESGYMLHPGDENFHDWAETYFEGVGWVPTDPSFGRSSVDTSMHGYYATGLDVYRLATNESVNEPLSPAKTFIRSETVDFQPGEVEWKGGNLFYDKWDSHMNVDSFISVKN